MPFFFFLNRACLKWDKLKQYNTQASQTWAGLLYTYFWFLNTQFVKLPGPSESRTMEILKLRSHKFNVMSFRYQDEEIQGFLWIIKLCQVFEVYAFHKWLLCFFLRN